MNLLTDKWLPIIRKDGKREEIAIKDIVADYNSNPVLDLEAPRPDFRNAMYQLFIGIFQVSAAPEGGREWKKLWDTPYTPAQLEEKFQQYEKCFVLDNPEGPAFMQDYDWKELSGAKSEGISGLLIDAPGTNTIKENKDHFVKRGIVESMSPYWAGIALYTLQAFAPAGGQGHRVGLRGGGPLTNMVIPRDNEEKRTLWEKLWLNILLQSELELLSGNNARAEISDIFPWMGKTRTSLKNEETYPDHCHPLQMYFGMPRRIRLDFSKGMKKCNIDGRERDGFIVKYHTLSRGVNYGGAWVHPLNAYSLDPKKPDSEPLSIKAQPGGVRYRHWSSLSLEPGEGNKSRILAKVVRNLHELRQKGDVHRVYGVSTWAAGYDMDNAKARCWYETTLPCFTIEEENAEIIEERTEIMTSAALECAKGVKSCVKQAWFDRPKDAKGDMSFLDTAFWQETENDFYSILGALMRNPVDENLVSDSMVKWKSSIQKKSFDLFDKWVLSADQGALDMKRVVRARKDLKKTMAKVSKSFSGLIIVE
jgi:CRISPR system Cascade subunit CasA